MEIDIHPKILELMLIDGNLICPICKLAFVIYSNKHGNYCDCDSVGIRQSKPYKIYSCLWIKTKQYMIDCDFILNTCSINLRGNFYEESSFFPIPNFSPDSDAIDRKINMLKVFK